jgi:hypothetical protein
MKKGVAVVRPTASSVSTYVGIAQHQIRVAPGLTCVTTPVTTYKNVLSPLCYAMLCHAMLCYAMLCYAMLWGPPGTTLHSSGADSALSFA